MEVCIYAVRVICEKGEEGNRVGEVRWGERSYVSVM